MNSIGADDYIQCQKLLIHIAENGYSYEIDCDESTTVEAIQHCLESLSGIHFNDQLLLCLDVKLEPQRALLFYKLPANDKEVFLYNRARLLPDSPNPPSEVIDIPEIVDIPAPTSSSQNSHPLDNEPDPALKALPSYEQQFRYHYQRGNAIYTHTRRLYSACESLLQQQRVQERALQTATCNMDRYYRIIQQMYEEFMKCFSHQHRSHSEILTNFSKDLERLKSCKLHPAIQTNTRKCLFDFVKEENLQKLVEICSASHKQFETKVSQLKAMFNELKNKVDNLFSSKTSNGIMEVENLLGSNRRFLDEQKSIMQSLSKDVDIVKKLIDDCLRRQISASIRPHDAVSALGPMYDVHDKNHLPRMVACNHLITKLLDTCMVKKNEMNLFVHNCMQKVAHIQFIIKDIRQQFPVFKEAHAHLDDVFVNLKATRKIGPAYRACLAEVVRRKASMKLYMGLAGHFAEKLATKRELEVRRREEFLKTHGDFIPRDVLSSMGLFDSPSQCDVSIVPFDTNLMDIDIADVDRFAPEHLISSSLKGDRFSSSKSKISKSDDNCHPPESPENLVYGSRFDSEQILEDCEIVDIVGTNKVEVEKAWLKAELASAKALLCSIHPFNEHDSVDGDKFESILKSAAEKTTEALNLKDEYSKHLEEMLKKKHSLCLTYERRIQELERRLSEQFLHVQKVSIFAQKTDECKSEILGDEDGSSPDTTSELMDEASSTSAFFYSKLDQISRQMVRTQEGIDENMLESTGTVNHPLTTSMDASMHDPRREESQSDNKFSREKVRTTSISEHMLKPLNMLPCEISNKIHASSDSRENLLVELQNTLAEKSNRCNEIELQLEEAVQEASRLRGELEISRKFLDESQMNCARLESCLHGAREEAHTNLCVANRKASEYSSLGSSAVKMGGLFERLRSCISSAGGVAGFSDSLRALALSLSSIVNENEDESTADLQACIKVLANEIGFLSRHHAELLERCSRAETSTGLLTKELQEKKELVKTLYSKHQHEKQMNKEKISFCRLEVHLIAAFILNSAGHYEAINKDSLNYYLSGESIALFTDHLPSKPSYIVGQIVHIERNIVLSDPGDQGDSSKSDTTKWSGAGSHSIVRNPYNLPIGCEYFIVTIAMLPNTIHSSSSSSSPLST